MNAVLLESNDLVVNFGRYKTLLLLLLLLLLQRHAVMTVTRTRVSSLRSRDVFGEVFLRCWKSTPTAGFDWCINRFASSAETDVMH